MINIQFYTMVFVAFAFAVSAIGVIGIWVYIRSRRW